MLAKIRGTSVAALKKEAGEHGGRDGIASRSKERA